MGRKNSATHAKCVNGDQEGLGLGGGAQNESRRLRDQGYVKVDLVPTSQWSQNKTAARIARGGSPGDEEKMRRQAIVRVRPRLPVHR